MISQEIENFAKHMVEFRKNLNSEGIWLFIVTIGIFGITDNYLQMYALVFTFFLFLSRITIGLDDKRTSFEIYKALLMKIKQSDINDTVRKTYLDALDGIKNDKQCVLKEGWIFLFAFLFYGFTCMKLIKTFFNC
ncbi:MAG: hypothetical protein NTZ60_09165 [Campylobacterales bacterium]|nr:hypothetical protein [Campylobacterales bacterium]